MNRLRPLVPTGELEQLQLDAASNISSRPAFWRKLLESDVWVVSDAQSDTELTLHVWSGSGEDTCPVFTSESLLENVMEPGTPWIEINASTVFQSMVERGVGAFINPRHEGQVRLRSRELIDLLAGQFETVRGSDA
jgi:hypothetical protein